MSNELNGKITKITIVDGKIKIGESIINYKIYDRMNPTLTERTVANIIVEFLKLNQSEIFEAFEKMKGETK